MSCTLADVRRITEDVLFPAATRTEREGRTLPRGNLDALASAGLFGAYAPRRYGGLDLPEDDRLRARARSHEPALRITGALVAAGGGHSVEAGSDAQRLLREAAFFSIRSQSGQVRATTVEHLAAVGAATDVAVAR